jgi:hypothetical protein
MNRWIVAMVATLAIGLGIPLYTATSVAAVSVFGTAGSHVPSPVKCTTVNGTIDGDLTVANCTPSDTEVEATILTIAIWVGNGGTLTWNDGLTTVVSGTYTLGGNACAVGELQINATGSVTGGTSTYTKRGDVVSGIGCVNFSTGAVNLATDTTLEL